MPSAARSRLLPEPWVFFLDRSLGSRLVAEALRAEGETVEAHDAHFTKDASDVEWLGAAGRKGWVVVSKDDRIRLNEVERMALAEAGVAAFFLGRSDLTGLRGSFDKFAASNKVKKGTTEVDNAFLAEIESWRSIFAHNIALRNPRLSQRELNFAVQRTIDRLIFLRICEDRGIEDYGKLLGHLNGENVYKRLCALFREADDRYNSGLFHFREEKGRDEAPDGLTLSLSIDDRVLKDLIRGMYYPESPYEFSVLPADILGQVYER